MSCENCKPMNYRINAKKESKIFKKPFEIKNKLLAGPKYIVNKICNAWKWLPDGLKVLLFVLTVVGFLLTIIIVPVILITDNANNSQKLKDEAQATIDESEFIPNLCEINYKSGQYEIFARPMNIKQKNRVIGGTDSLENSEALAKKLKCKKLKSTTGDYNDFNN